MSGFGLNRLRVWPIGEILTNMFIYIYLYAYFVVYFYVSVPDYSII